MDAQKTTAKRQGPGQTRVSSTSRSSSSKKPTVRGGDAPEKAAGARAASAKGANIPSARSNSAHAFPLLMAMPATPAVGAVGGMGGVAPLFESSTREVDPDESLADDGSQPSSGLSESTQAVGDADNPVPLLELGAGAIAVKRGIENKKMLPDYFVIHNGQLLDDEGLEAFRKKYIRNSRRSYNPERGLDKFTLYHKKKKRFTDRDISLETFGDRYGFGAIRAMDGSAGNPVNRQPHVALVPLKNLNHRLLPQYIIAALGIPLDDQALKGYITDYNNKKDLYDSLLTFDVYDQKTGALLDKNLMLGRLGKKYGFDELALRAVNPDDLPGRSGA
jgi:hypothetical protein